MPAPSYHQPSTCVASTRTTIEFFLAGLDQLADVIRKARIPTGMPAQAGAVDPDDAVAIHAVELEPDRFAFVLGGDREGATIPADRVTDLRADRFVAVALVRVLIERQLDNPVVGQIDLPPGAVVEIGFDERDVRRRGSPWPRQCAAAPSSLRSPIVRPAFAQAGKFRVFELVARIRRLAKIESPAKIHKHPFTPADAAGASEANVLSRISPARSSKKST